jgi:D-proline reductase (dithiol) PrdB
MNSFSKFKNRNVANLTSRFPFLAKATTSGFSPLETVGAPWTPVSKPLAESKVALVTTAGIHHRKQHPFDMRDPNGDPSFRTIDLSQPLISLTITHDYYDHSDADRDLNIVFPIQRLWALKREGMIGEVAGIHYGFMGHIMGRHIHTLINEKAPAVAQRLKDDNVDIVLLTPG